MKKEINIPFFGFYESIYDSEMDSVVERESEYLQEYYDLSRFESCDVFDALHSNCNWEQIRQEIIKDYISAFNSSFESECSIDLGLDSVVMESPSEYNFTTDRLFSNISDEKIKELYNASKENKHVELAKIIKEKFTSYDGFISFYPNDINSWIEKGFKNWDSNELGALLLAILAINDIDRDEFEFDMMESENLFEDISNAVSNTIDWHKVEAKLEIAGLAS